MHQIGVGVLGPVFRTYHPEDDRLVALKAFHLDLTPEQASTLAAALTDVVQAGVAHPCLVTPLGAGLSDDVAYLAMEFVAADSLDVAIRQYAPGAVETALPIVVQLAEAIDVAHGGGLTHGALHLRDVFVTAAHARVTGFGVVKALDRVKLRGPLRRPYTAPEQIAGAEWGPAADRFALAAIAYELLTGKRLAGTGTQVTDRLPDIAGVRDVASLTRLFAGALADTPERRPASARLFADALADAVGWTEVDTVRKALVTMDSTVADPEHQGSDDVPVSAVAGDSARPSARGETTGTEGAALDMARTRRESLSEPALDWTERKLDRGESEELRAPDSFTVGYEPLSPAEHRTVPDFDRIDAVLETTLDDAIAAYTAEVADGSTSEGVGQEPAAQMSTPAEPPAPLNDDDGDDDAGGARAQIQSAPEAGAVPTSSAGLLFDQPDVRPDVELDVSDGVAPVPTLPDADPDVDAEAGAEDDVADDDADLSVVQARYRSLDVSSEPPDSDPDSQAAGVYEAISITDLQDRLEATAGESEDSADDATERGTDVPAGPEARGADGDVDGRGEPTLLFESDAQEDDADRHEHDQLQAGLVASGWADRARRVPVVPVALVGVVVIVAAFAVGYRLFDGGDDVATAASSAAGGLLAGDVADLSEAPVPVEPAPQVSREFSEASVARSPVVDVPVEARVETPPAPPAVASAPEAPEVSEPAGQGAPVAAREAPATPGTPEPARPTANGRLLLRSTPPGVRVVVNGEARGTTPLALADLSYGAYDIRFSLEGYESQARQLAISSDDPIATINAELLRVTATRTASLGVGSIFVDTRPRGVEVWLDRQLIGESPMLIPNVSTGGHEVEFRHAGYRTWTTTVQVGSSAQARVTASLDHVPR